MKTADNNCFLIFWEKILIDWRRFSSYWPRDYTDYTTVTSYKSICFLTMVNAILLLVSCRARSGTEPVPLSLMAAAWRFRFWGFKSFVFTSIINSTWVTYNITSTMCSAHETQFLRIAHPWKFLLHRDAGTKIVSMLNASFLEALVIIH